MAAAVYSFRCVECCGGIDVMRVMPHVTCHKSQDTPHTCRMRRGFGVRRCARVVHRLDRRRRWCGGTCGGALGVLTVGYSTYSPGYFEYSHLQYTAVCSCHSTPRPPAALVPVHLRWGTRTTHSGVTLHTHHGTVSTRTLWHTAVCSCHSPPRPSAAAAVPAHQQWGTRSTHSGVLGVRTVGYSEYSQGGAEHTAGALECRRSGHMLENHKTQIENAKECTSR